MHEMTDDGVIGCRTQVALAAVGVQALVAVAQTATLTWSPPGPPRMPPLPVPLAPLPSAAGGIGDVDGEGASGASHAAEVAAQQVLLMARIPIIRGPPRCSLWPCNNPYQPPRRPRATDAFSSEFYYEEESAAMRVGRRSGQHAG